MAAHGMEYLLYYPYDIKQLTNAFFRAGHLIFQMGAQMKRKDAKSGFGEQ
jgi:hypothetical protein